MDAPSVVFGGIGYETGLGFYPLFLYWHKITTRVVVYATVLDDSIPALDILIYIG